MSTVNNVTPIEVKSVLLSSLLHLLCKRDVYFLFTEFENWKGQIDEPFHKTAMINGNSEAVFNTRRLRWPIMKTREC